jgi:hypothetical protein
MTRAFDILDKDEAQARSAKARAFLNVPLYDKTFQEFWNCQLPPRPHGLENAFVSFGVAAKQKDKARHAFENSARLAGFFEHGNDKLVAPVIASVGTAGISRQVGTWIKEHREGERERPRSA